MALPSFFTHLIEEAQQIFFVYSLDNQQITYINAAYEQVLQGHRETVM